MPQAIAASLRTKNPAFYKYKDTASAVSFFVLPGPARGPINPYSLKNEMPFPKKVPRSDNSALNEGMSAFFVRQFFVKDIISEHIESAIDNHQNRREYFIGKENKMAYNQNYSHRNNNDEVHFDLMEHIGVLGTKDNGWTKEVNIVAWNGGKAKVDIRDWDPDHARMTKGITLFEKEAENLVKVLARRYGLRFAGTVHAAAEAAAAAPAVKENVCEESACGDPAENIPFEDPSCVDGTSEIMPAEGAADAAAQSAADMTAAGISPA